MVSSVPYEVVRHLGDAELRRYGTWLLATVYDLDEDEAFQMLFRYIDGDNALGTRFPIVVPVLVRVGEPTDPESEGQMSFVLPYGLDLVDVARPNDPRIVLETEDGGLFAVMRFRGMAEGADLLGRTSDLLTELKEADFEMDGRPFLMRYNSPLTPAFMRHSEVAVRVIPGSIGTECRRSNEQGRGAAANLPDGAVGDRECP